MVEMVMMMIPMKSSVMAVTMASISPSGREFPPADPVCRRAFLRQRWARVARHTPGAAS